VTYIDEQLLQQKRLYLSLHVYMNKKTWSRRGGEGLVLIVPSSTLMIDCDVQVVTHMRTDMAAEYLHVGMLEECRKNRLAFDSQRIGLEKVVLSNDRLLPSV
jgi:hypothetical protein